MNPEAFVDGLDDPTAAGGPIPLPDGSTVARLPSTVRWIWDGDVSGAIGFRWQAGTAELPPYVLGHIGFSVVPWKRGNGYAKQALNLMLGKARRQGLSYVELTVDPEKYSFAAGDRSMQWCLDRTLQKGGGLWRCGVSSLPH
ncbi:GNAT family N-acetyltransferase [Paraburkholderia agricolaris]|uniref:GNAT family N-acetyltransferase n=1 Tax=Paraburkholderia agricolaris TaxID=2152888 RepID=UPI001C2C4950